MTSKSGGADPVAVADADLVVAEPLDREVLAELSVDEVVSSELALPVAVRVDLVDEDGALLAAVPREVALAVAVDVERLRTRRGPVTGSLKTPVKTVFPCQGTSFGMPTLTDTSVPTGCASDRIASATSCSFRSFPRLLEVVLHDLGTSQRGTFGIAARRAQRAPLAEQIPAPVE